MAGYSGTPLPKKLGVKEGSSLLLVDAPADFDDTLGALPAAVDVRRGLRSRAEADVIVCFTKDQRSFHKRFDAARARLYEHGGLWFAWPKRSSGVESDMTEDVVRRHGLAMGLVDNKVCAIDETWSGLRLVVRVADRKTKKPRS